MISLIVGAQNNLVIETETVNGLESFAVRTSERPIVRFYGYRAGIGGAEQRAYRFAARLTQLAAMGVSPTDNKFYAGFRGDKAVVAYGHHIICEITPAEVSANKSYETKIARDWLVNIRYYLASFPLTAESEPARPAEPLPAVGRARRYQPQISSEGFVIAHRALPLGTRVRVINLFNRWSTIAVVADHRVPSGDYLIGIGPHSARALGLTDDSAILVRLEKTL